MTSNRWQQSLSDLSNALDRLQEILSEPITKNSYVLDATIHRFEFCYELCWKTFKHLLAYDGQVDINSPREAFKQAYKRNWINDEELWLDMINDRNLTSHTYRQPTALEVYEDIKIFYPKLRETCELLKKQYVK